MQVGFVQFVVKWHHIFFRCKIEIIVAFYVLHLRMKERKKSLMMTRLIHNYKEGLNCIQ